MLFRSVISDEFFNEPIMLSFKELLHELVVRMVHNGPEISDKL